MTQLLGIIIQLVLLIACIGWAVKLGARLAQLRILKAKLAPKPPRNIRLKLTDGLFVPVDPILSPVRTWYVRVPDYLAISTVIGVACDELPKDATLEVRPHPTHLQRETPPE